MPCPLSRPEPSPWALLANRTTAPCLLVWPELRPVSRATESRFQLHCHHHRLRRTAPSPPLPVSRQPRLQSAQQQLSAADTRRNKTIARNPAGPRLTTHDAQSTEDASPEEEREEGDPV